MSIIFSRIITYIPLQHLYTNTSPVMPFNPLNTCIVQMYSALVNVLRKFFTVSNISIFHNILILVHTLLFSIFFVVIIIIQEYQSFSCYFCFSDWGRNCYVKTSSWSKGETVSRNQTAVGYNSMVTVKGWISPAVSKSTRNPDVCFSHFRAAHETLWCNHCIYKTSLTAHYFCTVVAAFARCSFATHKTLFQDLYNWWKETSEQKEDNANLCKTKWSGTEKQQLNKYKQAWIHTSFHRKSVRFLKNEIIYFTENKAFQVEIMPISFLNDSETQDFGELKSKNVPKGEHAPDSPRSLHLWCLFRKLVSIYPRSVPDKVEVK